jgi:hypothetical protein
MLSFGMANLTGFHGHFMAASRWMECAFRKGPRIFNLGPGITPDADPDTGQLMIDTVRGASCGTLACNRRSPFWGHIDMTGHRLTRTGRGIHMRGTRAICNCVTRRDDADVTD